MVMTWLFSMLHNVGKFRVTFMSFAECNWKHRPVFCFQDARFMWPHRFLSYIYNLSLCFHKVVQPTSFWCTAESCLHCSLCCFSYHWTITVHMNFIAIWQAIEWAIYVKIMKFVTKSNTTWITDAVARGLNLILATWLFLICGQRAVDNCYCILPSSQLGHQNHDLSPWPCS